MVFTAAATTELAKRKRRGGLKLELKTNFAESSSWVAVPWKSISWRHRRGEPKTLSADLINADFPYLDERDKANRGQCFAHARLTAYVASESSIVFDGRIFANHSADHGFSIEAQCWRARLNDAEASVQEEPDAALVIADGAYRQVVLLNGGAHGRQYGFAVIGGGSDEAFDEATQTRQRAWQPGPARLYYDTDDIDNDEEDRFDHEVPRSHYEFNWTSGTLTILEVPEDESGNPLSYYLKGALSAYKESAATGASNCDWTRVIEAGLTTAAADGGIGATGAELDLDDLGLDLPGAFVWPAEASDSRFMADLLREVEQRTGLQMALTWNGDSGKWQLRKVEQQASPDWSTVSELTVAQPRDTRDLYSRVVCTGLSELPVNALADWETAGLPSAPTFTDISGGADWAHWDGYTATNASSFDDAIVKLFDGDHTMGLIAQNIPGADYDDWVPLIKCDLHALLREHRCRARMPGSRNPNHGAGHQGTFHPGVQIMVSRDDVTYTPLSPMLDQVGAKPQELIDISGKQLTAPEFRYFKIYGRTFKFGIGGNGGVPGAGLGELELYPTEVYRVVKELQGSNPAGVFTFTDGSTASSYNPSFLERLGLAPDGGQIHKTLHKDLSDRFNELLAHDVAIHLLKESERLFQNVSASCAFDPRFDADQTIEVIDSFYGDVEILAEEVTHKWTRGGSDGPASAVTTISGANYRAEAFGNDG